MTTATCSRCGETKHLDEMSVRGFACKACINAYMREWRNSARGRASREKNKARTRARARALVRLAHMHKWELEKLIQDEMRRETHSP